MSARASGALRTGHGVVLAVAGALLATYLVALLLSVLRADDLPEVAFHPWSSEAGRGVLAGWGVPVRGWVGYLALLSLLVAAAGVVAAYLILRGARSWFRLYLVLVLVLLATAAGHMPLLLGALYPRLADAGELLQGLAWVSLFPLAYVFPDGRFVPRWSRWLALAWAVYLAGAVVAGLAGVTGGGVLEDAVLLFLFGSCVVAQIYRYRWVSGPVERQQAKWVLLALALWFGLAVSSVATPLRSVYFEASERGLVTFAVLELVTAMILALIPAAVAIAILRHRLFDVDVWMSRALVYAVLTAFVVGTYAAVVGGVGVWWAGGTTAVLPLLAAGLVALAFSPVREWVQRRVNRLVYGERDDPYGVLSRLGRQLAGVVRPEAVAPTIVDAVVRALRAPYAAITAGSPGEVVASTGQPVGQVETFRLSHRGELLGQLTVGRRGPGDQLSAADRRLLADLAGHCGAALYAAQESMRTRQLATDLQRVREQLVTTREEERRRLRRDLHDSLGPALGGQALIIDTARALSRSDPAAADVLLRDLKVQSQEALAEVRRLAYQLRPPALDELGLAAAVGHACEAYQRQGLAVRFDTARLPALPAAVEVAAYRIATEALTNVVRHAHARTCDLSLAVTDHALRLEVADDGRGIGPDDRPGVGTASMRERAEELGGALHIEPAAGGGTRVVAVLPLAGEK